MASVSVACGGTPDKPETYVEIEGICVGRYLLVHRPHPFGEQPGVGWNLTHRPTGLAVISSIRDKRAALRAAEKVRKFARASGFDMKLNTMAKLRKEPCWGELAELVRVLREKIKLPSR